VERGTLLTGALLATAVLVGSQDYADLALAGAQVGASAVNQKYDRDAEREADYYGIQYMARAGYDAEAAVDLQQTFVRLNDERRQDWLSGLFASHPPSQERVDNNRRTVDKVGWGGVRGEDAYQKRIAHLKKVKPAYDAYDKGREALSKGDSATAMKLAEQAIAVEPREALFHGLKGDALAKRGDYRAALASYDGAVRRDSAYYRHFLVRGLVREKLGDNAGARSDLERSMTLLPTNVAKDHLVRLRSLR
jgi:predicted Zn-dependent protease